MSRGKLIGIVFGALAALVALNLAAYMLPEEGTKSHAVVWIAKIFNFAVFASVLAWALLKKVNLPAMMEENRLQIQRSLEEAERKQQEAQQRLAEVEARLKAMDEETKRITDEARVQAKKDAEALKAEAQAMASRMLEKAEREITLRSEAARRELLDYATKQIMAEALREAQSRMDDERQRRIVERAVASIEEKFQ